MENEISFAVIAGTITITAALLAYSIAVITEQIKKKANRFILTFITLGLILDVTATSFMIYGSSISTITIHGALGYSALLGMAIDVTLIWKNYLKYGENIKNSIHRYSLIAYLWWVTAFITGGMLVAFSH
ncbi:MAG: hypothetical protein ABFS32_11215 [Bacteroidota bacterium]